MAISQDRLTALLSSWKLQLQAWSADGRLSSAAQEALQMGVASAPELSGRRSTLLVFDASLAGIDVLLAGADASAVRLSVRPEDDAIALIATAAAEGAYADLVVVAHASPRCHPLMHTHPAEGGRPAGNILPGSAAGAGVKAR